MMPGRQRRNNFSTVAKSAAYDTKTQSNRPRTVYPPSAARRGQPSRVPDVPLPPKDIQSFLLLALWHEVLIAMIWRIDKLGSKFLEDFCASPS